MKYPGDQCRNYMVSMTISSVYFKMELDPKYTFIPLAPKQFIGIDNNETQELLKKWGLKANISIQTFSFNEPFQPYHKYHLAEAFFKDETVAKTLLISDGYSWKPKGIIASSVETKHLPTTVLNMSFFDKLRDPENNVVHASGSICKRYDTVIEEFFVSDNLRGMLLDEECDEYNLYNSEEREEFIFRILQLLVIGGELCQYEDFLAPYLEVTKAIYKDLIRVETKNTDELSIATTVLEVVARDSKDDPYFPANPHNRQNVGFLLIDGSTRRITTFAHQFK